MTVQGLATGSWSFSLAYGIGKLSVANRPSLLGQRTYGPCQQGLFIYPILPPSEVMPFFLLRYFLATGDTYKSHLDSLWVDRGNTVHTRFFFALFF